MLRPLLLTVMALFAIAAPASAAVNGFEGSDGDQACQVGVDWSCLPSTWGLSSTTDAAGSSDVVFSSGKEEQPNTWTFGTGGTNSKTDLTNVWASSVEPGDDSFLFLAFHRVSGGTSNAFVSFELNQVRAAWQNAQHVMVPCRTDGDVLISYELPNTIKLYKWSGSGGPASCPDGATGSWDGPTGVAATRESSVNAGTIVSTLPDGPASMAATTFGETAVNMGELAREVDLTQTCEFFESFQSHTRESASFSADMGDYVDGGPINVGACAPPDGGGDTTPPADPTLQADAGCHASGTVTLSGTTEPGALVQVKEGSHTVADFVVAAADGSWTAQVDDVSDGAHTYTAKARDAAGNVSGETDLTVTVDATPPAPPAVTYPGNGATVAPGSLLVAGTAEPGSNVTIHEGATVVGQATAGADGVWYTTLTGVTA